MIQGLLLTLFSLGLVACVRGQAPSVFVAKPASVQVSQRQNQNAPSRENAVSPAEWTPLRWIDDEPNCLTCNQSRARPKLLFPQCLSPVLDRADGNILYVKDGVRRLAPRHMGDAVLFPFGSSARTLLPGTVIAYYPFGSDRYRFLFNDGRVAESEQVFGEAKEVGQPLPAGLVRAVVGKRAALAHTSDGLFRSIDGMAHWQEIRLDYARPSPYTIDELNMNARGEGVLYLSPERVYRTVDDGETWQRVASLGQEHLTYRTLWDLDPNFAGCDEPPPFLSSCGPATLLDDGWACLAADGKQHLVVVTHADDQSKVVPWPVATCRPETLAAYQSTLWVSCIDKAMEAGVARYPGPYKLFYSNDDGATFSEDSGLLIGNGVDWRAGPGGSLLTVANSEIQWRPGRRVLTELAPAWIGLGAATKAAAFASDPPGLWALAKGSNGLVLKLSPINSAQFVEKRTLGNFALANQVSEGVSELTSLEVDNDQVGVVLNTESETYYHFDSVNKVWEYYHPPLGPRGGAVGGRMLTRWPYTKNGFGNVVGESNDGGHTFQTFLAYSDYHYAECNRAGCLFENAYRRGWDLPRGAPVVRQRESPARIEASVPHLECNSIAGEPKPIKVTQVLQPRYRGDALAAGLSALPNGRAILHTVERRGVHTQQELLAPSGERWTKNGYGEAVVVLENGVVFRYRSLASAASDDSAWSEIEWAYLEWPSRHVWRGRRRVPVPASELSFAKITPWRDWAVLTTDERQIVIPANPREAPYFTREGKPKPRCGQCLGPTPPNQLFMKGGTELWAFGGPGDPSAQALVGEAGFSWHMVATADPVVRDDRMAFYTQTSDKSALAMWDVHLSQIPSTRPEPKILPLPPDLSTARVCPPKLVSGARFDVSYVKWEASYGDTTTQNATITFRSTVEGLCAESLEFEFRVRDELLFVPLADPAHSVAFQATTELNWRPVRCEPKDGWVQSAPR